MKTFLVIVLVLFGLTPEVICQPEIIIKKESLNLASPDADTLLNPEGKRVRFEFDTLFYVNSILINDYLDIIRKYNELYSMSGDMIDYMENFNKSMKTDFKLLTDNIDRSYQMIRDSLNVNNLRLDKWKSENSKLITLNNQLNVDLTQVREQMKSERWNSFGKKILYGGGGMVAGIGISALFVLIAK